MPGRRAGRVGQDHPARPMAGRGRWGPGGLGVAGGADNDPTRFWSYLVAALRTVEPGVGTVALEALGGPSVELERVVVPSLVNDLATVGAPLVLVLDDYHLITDAICHQTLGLVPGPSPGRGPCGAVDSA